MYLPEPSSSASAWAVSDYRQRTGRTQPAAGGVCQLDFGQVPEGELWLVERVVVSCDSSTPTAAFLYDTSVDDSRVLDGTRVGNFDVADNNSPIQVASGTTLVVAWDGASNGAIGQARVQYVVLRKDGY
ncbi:hypothetical protein [Nocardioides sp.]|uniref:hypothetical protein n=1 Tax=Nocardioides sp. TaxID=35761 RepID=UPI002CF02402|nr:hypothetical protein [Nocardioides sp.]HSX68134.1 hypothetical protein [Nocardioides sp.]